MKKIRSRWYNYYGSSYIIEKEKIKTLLPHLYSAILHRPVPNPDVPRVIDAVSLLPLTSETHSSSIYTPTPLPDHPPIFVPHNVFIDYI